MPTMCVWRARTPKTYFYIEGNSVNIFVLDKDYRKIPKHYCDVHLRKMILETAQLLCSVFPKGEAKYKPTHVNHPCAVWTRQSLHNYIWLANLGFQMGIEYYKRFGKSHKSEEVIHDCVARLNVKYLEGKDTLTEFPQCMPDEFKHKNPIKAYRKYYANKLKDFKKRGICKYTPYVQDLNAIEAT